MADGLSLGELGRQIGSLQTLLDRRLIELNSRLDKVVSQDVYTIQSTYTDQRITQLHGELQRCADRNEQLENEFEQYQIAERDRRERERQQRLYSAIIPILVAVVSSAIAIWAVVAK